MIADRIQAALGNKPADLVIENGQIVNVYTGEIYPGGVAISGDTIIAVGDVAYTVGADTQVLDAQGAYLTPGFIDGHIHPESTSLAIRPFAQIMLQHGVTTIFSDFHEVGVVAGLEGIEAILEEAKETDLKVYFVVPSHVPFSPSLETSGGLFDEAVIRKALARPDAVGLSECVCTYIQSCYPPLLASMADTLQARGTLQGHLPATSGPALNACMAAGIYTDHESFSGQDAIERLRDGCHAMLREGSVARNLTDCLQGILAQGLSLQRASIITDDLHTVDAVERGCLDDGVRTALKAGVSFVEAIQMVTLHAAQAFHLDGVTGGLAPGRRADVLLTTGPEDFRVQKVIAGGKLVAENGVFLQPYPPAVHQELLLHTMRMKRPVVPEDFRFTVDERAKAVEVHVIDTLDWIPITNDRHVVLPVKDGIVECDPQQDVLYVAQVERYGKNGNIGKAFMGGFHLRAGAIASSVGHDNHNIIVLGTNHADMALAVNQVAALEGGQVAVQDGRVLAQVAYPVLGLMSDLPAETLAAQKKALIQAIQALGCPISMPFMFLSFLSLAAGGGYAITDHGFIDSAHQCVADPVIRTLYEM